MAHVDLLTPLLYQLDDMIAKLSLHNSRHLFRIAQIKRNVGKLRHERASRHEAKLATLHRFWHGPDYT